MRASSDNILDNISTVRKTAILVVVITFGILFLGIFGYFSHHQLKNNFNTLYETRLQTISSLYQLQKIYISDLPKALISENNNSNLIILNLEEHARSTWKQYKEVDQQLESTMQNRHHNALQSCDQNINQIHTLIRKSTTQTLEPKNLQSNFDTLEENFTTLLTLQKEQTAQEKIDTDQTYTVVTWLMLFTTLFFTLFSIFFTLAIIKNIKKLIGNLSNIAIKKINDYDNLVLNYEDKVTKEIVRHRERDQLMYQQARLASMGDMIGNIAHQWRQPLNALMLLIQSFGTKSMQGKLDQAFIDKQVDEGLRLADQMSNTIEDFRNFFSPNRDREYFSIEKSLNDTLELVDFFCKDEHIHIEIKAKEDLRVFGYSNEFSQVILNLINNARENFKYRNINDNRKIIIKLEKKVKPKPYALISFIDNGGGVDPQIKDRIFEPYFTTKHKSAGTGIGLYMSKQIIEAQMNGVVTMKNIENKMGGDELYKCSQFIIAIPIR